MADLQAVKKEFRKSLHDLVEEELKTFEPHSGAQTIFEDLEFKTILKEKTWEKYVKTFERL